MQTVPLLFSFLFLHALVLFHSQRSGPILVPYRSACTAIATRFEGIIKPPFVSLLRPFELPMVEHKGRKRVCAFLPSVATFEVSNVSEGDCFAALLKSSCHSALAAAVAGRPPYRFGGAMGSSRPTVFGHAGAHACAPFGFGLRRMFPPKQSFCGAFRDPTNAATVAGVARL